MTIGHRIVQLRGEESRRVFAGRIGVVENTLRNYEQGLSLPNSDVVATICSTLGISPVWLLFGTARLPFVASADPGEELKNHSREAESAHSLVEPLVVRAQVFLDTLENDPRPRKKIRFYLEFLQGMGDPTHMVLMQVDSDSMFPEICRGDMVIIDRSQSVPRPGRIYAVSVENMVYLAEVNALPGKMVFSYANPAFAPLEIDSAAMGVANVRIIGRAVWWCREG